jgi:aquaporin Z
LLIIGTFVLVFASCGSAVLAGDRIGFLGISLAFGLSLLAMIYAIGPISGCHIDPAVTVGLLLTKKIDPKFSAGYIAAQIVGAILGCRCLLVIARGAPGGYDLSFAGFAANGLRRESALMPLAPISGSL